jgi:hypothetical protein
VILQQVLKKMGLGLWYCRMFHAQPVGWPCWGAGGAGGAGGFFLATPAFLAFFLAPAFFAPFFAVLFLPAFAAGMLSREI